MTCASCSVTAYFDCLHIGHLYLFREARKHASRLVISLVGDEFVEKGPARPVFDEHERRVMLLALRGVDKVLITTRRDWWEDHARALKPHAYVRGEEGTRPPEIALLQSLGAKIVFVPKLPKYSSTAMLERINAARVPDQ